MLDIYSAKLCLPSQYLLTWQIPGADEPADPGATMKATKEETTCCSVALLCLIGCQNALLNSGKIYLSIFKQRERGGWKEKGKRKRGGGVEAKEGGRQDDLKSASFNYHKFQYVLKEWVLNVISVLSVYST